MLKIQSHSENYEGLIEINGNDLCSISGSVTGDTIYMNMHSYDVIHAQAERKNIVQDIAEFADILLTKKTIQEENKEE